MRINRIKVIRWRPLRKTVFIEYYSANRARRLDAAAVASVVVVFSYRLNFSLECNYFRINGYTHFSNTNPKSFSHDEWRIKRSTDCYAIESVIRTLGCY